ncbi:putative OsmC-like protein [Christiangramia gaetbulicola]|uniref:Putative OsmC-like protein n=1 Tax=Christiangramia gaetbulicola TaxID=703340 RepID=A0A2T6AF29_9FLAO|nr:OsmC family protein [Christiangramia gaetbulicola]PTX42420.1 putative OsmC-like protein [Christiangramia gaetbulicola]
MTSKVKYLGSLRTESEHLQSGAKMITDAPVDNHGKGEAFSPTDTVANALATCMLTVMGIKAESLGVDMDGATAEVTKTMAADPRRISKIDVNILFPRSYEEKETRILENTGRTCPVLQSLHPDIEKNISFKYS